MSPPPPDSRRFDRRPEPPCADFATRRSAWVDGRLSAADTDHLMRHLVGCPACVRDVRELRRVRDLLGDSRPVQAPSEALAARLVNIAGGEAAEPMWTRTFRRVDSGSLPSRRRRRRQRVTAAVVLAVCLVAALTVTGYAVGPASPLRPVADPSRASRSEFAATVAQLPFGSDALAVVLLSNTSALQTDRAPHPVAVAQGRAQLDESAAAALLARASTAAGTVSYHGRQRIEIDAAVAGGSRTLDARATVSASPGDRTTVVVSTAAGKRVGAGQLKGSGSARTGSDPDVELVQQAYALTATTGISMLGRPVTVVQARAQDESLVARWWIDDASKLMLRQEVYAGGRLRLAAGFTSVSIGSASIDTRDTAVAPEIGAVHTSTAMLVSSAGSLASLGWTCAPHLSGLTLVQLRSDSSPDPELVHMVYSDGLRTVSVFERRGELQAAPAGSHWDRGRQAYVSTGVPATASWQSKDTVFTVVTDGDIDLMTQVVGSLPHDGAPRPTTMARIMAGWSRLLHHGS